MADRANFVTKSRIGLVPNGKIANADTGFLTLITGDVGGTRVAGINVTSDDTVARDLQLWINDGTDRALLGTIEIPITAGFIDSEPSVDMLNIKKLRGLERDKNGNPFIWLLSPVFLEVKVTVAVTAGKFIYPVALAADND